MRRVKDWYEDLLCPDCGADIPDYYENGDECRECGHVFIVQGYDENFIRAAVSYALANLDDLNQCGHNFTHENVLRETVTLTPVETLSLVDPDTDAPVGLAVFKDPTTGAFIGLDESHLEQDVSSGFYADPYNPGTLVFVE